MKDTTATTAEQPIIFEHPERLGGNLSVTEPTAVQESKQLRPDYWKLPILEWTTDEVRDRIKILEATYRKRRLSAGQAEQPEAEQRRHFPNYSFRKDESELAFMIWRNDDEACVLCANCASAPYEREFPLYADDIEGLRNLEPILCELCNRELAAALEQPIKSFSDFHAQALAIVKRRAAKADVNEALVADVARELEMASVRVGSATLLPNNAEAKPRRLSKPWDERLQENLRTDEEIIAYLDGRVEAIENYSPRDELACLVLAIGDVIKALRTRAAQPPIATDARKLSDLVIHCRIHSGYPNCGYNQMTTEQKRLYDSLAFEEDESPDAPGEQAAPVVDKDDISRWLMDLRKLYGSSGNPVPLSHNLHWAIVDGIVRGQFESSGPVVAAEEEAEKARDMSADAIQQRAARARDIVSALCHGEREWKVSIPAQPNDPDVILDDALRDLDYLVYIVRHEDAPVIEPASLSAERCQEILSNVPHGSFLDAGYLYVGNEQFSLLHAQIVCAYYLEHGLVREGEAK